MEPIYSEKFIAPYFPHHLDSRIGIGRNVIFYKLEIFPNALSINIYPKFLRYFLVRTLRRREIELPFYEIISIRKKKKNIIIEFEHNARRMTYVIYSYRADEILKLLWKLSKD